MNCLIKAILIAVTTFMMTLVLYSVETYAAENDLLETRFVNERISVFGKNGKYFDYVAYADTYPDLYAVFGYDKKALWNHYISCGVYENRAVSGTNPSATAKIMALNVAASVTNSNMSDRDKALAIHNWIVNSTGYDYGNYLAGTIPDISYTKEGVFINHVAVCSGYADAFSYLAKIVGLNCEIVDGTATNSIGYAGGHAWNRVLIDGSWLYVDCTWDDPVCDDGSNMLRYDYFLIPEEAMAVNHRIESVYRLY